ncbi:DgyrCDS10202 [Dimorphilus gyrociliatus]|uniref:DgyrCDS10202 n=1 Tax=Dimorphilus gyrociliatus TaxID=2664684 RepID=A0A7I8VZF5_9ANNE|nr:DgyrCDS10202 [Dimorphilus gyrociliatus]
MDIFAMIRIWSITYFLLLIASLHNVLASPCYSCMDAKMYSNDNFIKTFLQVNSKVLKSTNCKSLDNHTPTSPCVSNAGANPFVDEKCGTFNGKVKIAIRRSYSPLPGYLYIDGMFRQCVGVVQSYKNKCYGNEKEMHHIMDKNLFIYQFLKANFKSKSYNISTISGSFCLCEGEYCNNDCNNGFWFHKKANCLKYWVVGLIAAGGLLVIVAVILFIKFILKRSRGKTSAVQPNSNATGASMTPGIALTVPSGQTATKSRDCRFK